MAPAAQEEGGGSSHGIEEQPFAGKGLPSGEPRPAASRTRPVSAPVTVTLAFGKLSVHCLFPFSLFLSALAAVRNTSRNGSQPAAPDANVANGIDEAWRVASDAGRSAGLAVDMVTNDTRSRSLKTGARKRSPNLSDSMRVPDPPGVRRGRGRAERHLRRAYRESRHQRDGRRSVAPSQCLSVFKDASVFENERPLSRRAAEVVRGHGETGDAEQASARHGRGPPSSPQGAAEPLRR